MLDDRVTSVLSMVLTTDVDSIVDDKVAVANFGGDPHITLRFPRDPPEIQGTINFKRARWSWSILDCFDLLQKKSSIYEYRKIPIFKKEEIYGFFLYQIIVYS